MKKFISVFLVLFIVISFSACGEKLEVDSFSYSEDSIYWMSMSGNVGMKTEGFKNVSEQKIKNAEDVLELAKNEVVVTYDSVAVAFDDQEKIWRVDFWTEDQDGGNQIVYLNEYGQTQICISEE